MDHRHFPIVGEKETKGIQAGKQGTLQSVSQQSKQDEWETQILVLSEESG